MTAPKLLVENNGRQVVTLTLNRPELGNACDPDLLNLLADALTRAGADPSVRVVVLRGAGRHFCSGLDVSAPREAAPPGSAARASFLDVCRLLDAIPKPTIAVLQGGCIGGGVALAACSDMVLASTEAFFAVPEVRIGIAPGALALLVMRAIGHRSLRRYLLSGERFSAERARELQLVHEVRQPAELEVALGDLIDAVLLGGPKAITSAKAILMRYGAAAMSGSIFDEIEASFAQHAASAEAIEGKASFREKRRASWYPARSS